MPNGDVGDFLIFEKEWKKEDLTTIIIGLNLSLKSALFISRDFLEVIVTKDFAITCNCKIFTPYCSQ